LGRSARLPQGLRRRLSARQGALGVSSSVVVHRCACPTSGWCGATSSRARLRARASLFPAASVRSRQTAHDCLPCAGGAFPADHDPGMDPERAQPEPDRAPRRADDAEGDDGPRPFGVFPLLVLLVLVVGGLLLLLE